jgi:hypothetical protein
MLHTRPTYFEDLHDNTLAEEKRKLRYQNIFILTLQFGAAITTAVLVDYWMYQVKPDTTFTEIIGITGGILGIFSTFLALYGDIVLTILKKKKDKIDTARVIHTQNKYFRKKFVNGIEIVTLNPISKRTISSQNIASLDNNYSLHYCDCDKYIV